jgi:hypothetical protein
MLSPVCYSPPIPRAGDVMAQPEARVMIEQCVHATVNAAQAGFVRGGAVAVALLSDLPDGHAKAVSAGALIGCL